MVTALAPQPVALESQAPRDNQTGKFRDLVQQFSADLFALPNFGNKSLKEVKEKLATLGLTLGMTLDDDSCRDTIVAAEAAPIAAAEGGAT